MFITASSAAPLVCASWVLSYLGYNDSRPMKQMGSVIYIGICNLVKNTTVETEGSEYSETFDNAFFSIWMSSQNG